MTIIFFFSVKKIKIFLFIVLRYDTQLLTVCFIFTINLKLTEHLKPPVEKIAYLHIFDAQTLKIKPKNEAIIVMYACDKSFHSAGSPAVEHLSRSNCHNCALKLELQSARLNVNKIFSKQQNHSRAKSQAAML